VRWSEAADPFGHWVLSSRNLLTSWASQEERSSGSKLMTLSLPIRAEGKFTRRSGIGLKRILGFASFMRVRLVKASS
jgi:hypothetical protein